MSSSSFTEAARETGVSKSTLSRMVTMLEEYVGMPLLERTTRRVNATDAGHTLYNQCLEVYAAWLAARETIGTIKREAVDGSTGQTTK
ncbi:LysR family transcriptional regulator [Paraburkholderia sp. RL18-085-BIA-A]